MSAPCVPTGMKAGVGIGPWGVSRRPARARSLVRSSLKRNGVSSAAEAPPAAGEAPAVGEAPDVFVVALREPDVDEQVDKLWADLDARRLAIRLPEPQAAFPLLLAHPATAVALPRPGWTCHPLDAVHPASASAIRESASSGLRAEWLAPGVAEYVRKHRLYDA